MSVIYILITVSIVVAVIFLIAFVKAVRSGQYDDDYTPSVRMLFEDEIIKTNTNPTPDSSKMESKINKE
ncbi:MAG: cbb3-type cytochrome oxidase assembly protein CcoS [Flavobacterium sp.]